MASFWFVSAQLVSHTDWGGFLKTAQSMAARGHAVLWLSEAPLQAAIESAGIPFRRIAKTGWLWPPPPPPDFAALSPQEAHALRYKRALDTWLSEDLVAQAVEALLSLAEGFGPPDAIVSDPFLCACAIAAEALDVPLIICGWPAHATPDEQSLFPIQRSLSSDSQARVQRLCARFGVRGRSFTRGPALSIRSETLHVSYFTPAWHQSELASILPQTQFVGGVPDIPAQPPPQWLADIPDDAQLGLVTLGSIFTGNLAFFSDAAQALASAGILPIVAVGWNPIPPEQKAMLKRALPAGTRLLAWAPYEHLLPRCKMVIHHGGIGTTHHALVHGLPQIIVPQAAEQRLQARRASEAKVGLHLTAHDLRQGKLREAVAAILAADWVAENARGFARDMASLGGVERAADLVAEVMA